MRSQGIIGYHRCCHQFKKKGEKTAQPSMLLVELDLTQIIANPFSWKSVKQTIETIYLSGPVRLTDKPWLKVLLVDLLFQKNTVCSLKKYGL